MPRKPNYRFERAERDRRKAAKKADRLKAKQDKAALGTEEAMAAGAETAPSQD